MRRAAPALIATAGALGVLATFHTAPTKPIGLVAGAPLPTTTSPPTTAAAAPAAAAPPPPTTTTTAAAAVATRRATGPDIGTPYGDVQVQVIVRGDQMIDVRSIRLPFDRSRSQQLSDFAAPRLRAEVLRAQSADVNLVSGATYTSEGYVESLQGALDVLG